MFFVLSLSLLLSPASVRRKEKEQSKHLFLFTGPCASAWRPDWPHKIPAPLLHATTASALYCQGLEAFPYAPLCVSVQALREWCLRQPEQPFVMCFPGYLSFGNQSMVVTFLQMEAVRKQWRNLYQERLQGISAKCA